MRGRGARSDWGISFDSKGDAEETKAFVVMHCSRGEGSNERFRMEKFDDKEENLGRGGRGKGDGNF